MPRPAALSLLHRGGALFPLGNTTTRSQTSKRGEVTGRLESLLREDGLVGDFFQLVQPLISARKSYHAGHAALAGARYTQFRGVLAGGWAGRSIWDSRTYWLNSASFRPPMAYDDAFSWEEKRSALLQYYDAICRNAGFPPRSLGPQSPDEVAQAGRVLVLNREGRHRAIENDKDLVKALQARLGDPRVEPRVLYADRARLPHIIGQLRTAAVVITTHGAQMANLGFLLPGRGVVEVMNRRCFAQHVDPATVAGKMYMHFANFTGLHYRAATEIGRVPNNVRSCNSRHPMVVDVEALAAQVEELLAAIQADEAAGTTLRATQAAVLGKPERAAARGIGNDMPASGTGIPAGQRHGDRRRVVREDCTRA